MEKEKFDFIVILLKKPTKFISDGIFGEKHTLTHRTCVGVVLMVLGVGISFFGGEFNVIIIKMTCDGIGYLFHGLGCVPIFDVIKKLTSTDDH